MIDGPCSAPSSPPDTPQPTKWMPCSRRAASRRRVSMKWALPQSMTMSSRSSSGTSSSITASVGAPAFTMMITARGRSSEATKSSSDSDGDEAALVAVLFDQRRGARGRAVVQGDGVPVPGEVAGQVAPHDRQAGDADVRDCLLCHDFHRSAPGVPPDEGGRGSGDQHRIR